LPRVILRLRSQARSAQDDEEESFIDEAQLRFKMT